jgi:hypothetical protein
MSGAEPLLVPLLSALATFLSRWGLKKYQAAKEAKEEKYETQKLVEAVQKLASFANERADMIAQLHLDLNLHPSSLSKFPSSPLSLSRRSRCLRGVRYVVDGCFGGTGGSSSDSRG